MATISVTNINDGDAVTAASVNNQINTIVNDYNGNITDANISASAAIGAQKLAGGVSGMFGAWQTWTPSYGGSGSMTYTSVTTTVAVYTQMGKTVFFRIDASGTTGGVANSILTFTPPITAKSTSNGSGATIVDGGNPFTGTWYSNTTTQFSVSRYDASNFTLGTARRFIIAGVYEAA